SSLALYRLDHDTGKVLRSNGDFQIANRPLSCLSSRESVPKWVAHRGAIDLRGERPKTILIRNILGRHSHRQVRPTVVCTVHHRYRIASGVTAGDLHRILHSLRARVE